MLTLFALNQTRFTSKAFGNKLIARQCFAFSGACEAGSTAAKIEE
jgi:hypothetical protein